MADLGFDARPTVLRGQRLFLKGPNNISGFLGLQVCWSSEGATDQIGGGTRVSG